ncbi:MAG: hypothetical protein HY278_04360 [candidate division NC10 bacterium]|nr:hypothetical protein [candidate division NC10 bacterium]
MHLPAPLGQASPLDHGNTTAVDLHATLLRLASSIERQYVQVGRILLLARDQELFRDWGFTTLEAFGETVLHFKPYKLHYLMRVAATIDRLHITNGELADITWSKLLIIEPILTLANKVNWLTQAKASTVTMLRAEVARARGFAPPEAPLTTFSTRLSPTQRQTLEDALALSMRLADTTSRAVGLVSIAEEAISSFAPLLAAQDMLPLSLPVGSCDCLGDASSPSIHLGGEQ